MIETLFLPLALAFIMFSLGLALRPGDFRVALYGWRGIAMGLCGQVLLLPLLAFLISVALDLSPTAQLGLMLIAACPGGVSSAFLTHLARGNIALSLILTVTSSLLALLRGQWHYSSVYDGQVFMGSRNRLTPAGIETEALTLPPALQKRIDDTRAKLNAIE